MAAFLHKKDRFFPPKKILIFLFIISWALSFLFVSYSLYISTEPVHEDFEFFEVLRTKARDNTVMVIQISGDILLLKNLFCSLARIDVKLLSYVVLWAFDEQTYNKMKRFRRDTDKMFVSKPDNSTHSIPKFSILFDKSASMKSQSLFRISSDFKWVMMDDRPRFYLKVLEKGFNLFFVDSDIVFFNDPWKYIQEEEKNGTSDLVISTDARNWYELLNDPYESETFVPKICGGLFLARSSPNTIKLYQSLKFYIKWLAGNDQWTLDRILNSGSFDINLMEPLPRGIIPRETTFSKSSRILNIRLLDQWKFVNGILVAENFIFNRLSPIAKDYLQMLDSANGKDFKVMFDKYRGKPVAFHANFPERFNKIEKLKEIGLWLLDEKNVCHL